MAKLGFLLAIVFTALALWHFYWALGGKVFLAAAIPCVDGRPAFVPGRAMTAAVGGALLLCALLVVTLSRSTRMPSMDTALSGVGYALATALLVRAVGDFRLLGFFKRVRDGRFACLDSLVYSPLCLMLAVGVCALAFGHGKGSP